MRKRRFRSAPAIFLIIVLVGVAGYLLGWSKALEIRTIEIYASGNEALINPVLNPKDVGIGMPMARVSGQRISHDLARFSWVDTIKIKRRWLAHDLQITITEHKAIAQYVDSNGIIEYFDSKGFNFIAPHAPVGLPEINFAQVGNDSRSAIALYLSQVPSDLTAHLSSLSIDRHNQVAMTTTIPGFTTLSISWGIVSEMPLKVKVLRQLLTLKENKKITNIDLSNPMTPVVK